MLNARYRPCTYESGSVSGNIRAHKALQKLCIRSANWVGKVFTQGAPASANCLTRGFVTSDHPVGMVWQESPLTAAGRASHRRTRLYPFRFRKPWPSAGISTLRGHLHRIARTGPNHQYDHHLLRRSPGVFRSEQFGYVWDGQIKRNSGAGLLNDLLAVRKGDVR
jgi:hypothetical protein